MKIDPSEVKTIKNIGNLHGEEVKLVATKGGLYLALGRKSKSKKNHEPLAAGSHPALVLHQIEKEYKSDFQPSMTKSEEDQLHQVTELNCAVKGLSMFALRKNTELDIVIAKFGVEICKCECEINGVDLKIKKIDYRTGFDSSMKDVLRTEMNKGIIQTAKDQNIESFIK
jgi:hypothetical protein